MARKGKDSNIVSKEEVVDDPTFIDPSSIGFSILSRICHNGKIYMPGDKLPKMKQLHLDNLLFAGAVEKRL